MGVQPLESELLDVFKSFYGFETESFTIPLVESQFKLLERLVSWSRRSSGEDTLRIFVYSEHAGCAGTVPPDVRLSICPGGKAHTCQLGVN